jgi:hypothetical protein
MCAHAVRLVAQAAFVEANRVMGLADSGQGLDPLAVRALKRGVKRERTLIAANRVADRHPAPHLVQVTMVEEQRRGLPARQLALHDLVCVQEARLVLALLVGGDQRLPIHNFSAYADDQSPARAETAPWAFSQSATSPAPLRRATSYGVSPS